MEEQFTFLAIDPATKKCGVAWFKEGQLMTAATFQTKKTDRIERCRDILVKIVLLRDKIKTNLIVCEEPLLQGKANQTMQRFLGGLEACIPYKEFVYIHPMTVKKQLGSGTLDKLAVAKAAKKILKRKVDKEFIQKKIEAEEWDTTDAVAIGLAYMKGLRDAG